MNIMKKISRRSFLTAAAAVTAAGVLVGCGASSSSTAASTASSESAAEAASEASAQHFDKLTLEFVPSKDADVIIAGTQNLPELVQAEMAKMGYEIDEVDISVGTSYDATGEAMSAGTIDIGWLPGGTYALYSDDTEVILTATRNGLSNDSTDPATWNGDANATQKNGPQVTYYRSLIYATPSAYGKQLAEKVNNGEALTWEDLDGANWAVQKTSSSAGYIYPTMWLMENYDGKKISDLSHVTALDSGYGTAFSYAAAESVDVIVCYADGRNDYEESWQLPTDQQDSTGKQGMGRSDSIWNELNVIGVTEGIYNDTVAISKRSQYYTDELKAALQSCFINIIETDEGKEIFNVYSHAGYAVATDADYDGARAALQAVAD
jgi:phosphonate transport system substrate-binding protein